MITKSALIPLHIYICIFSCLLSVSSASAQTLLKEPLRYVPADSVVLWGNDRTNFVRTAGIEDSTLHPRPMPAFSVKHARRALRHGANTLTDADALLPWTADARYGARQERALFNELLPQVHDLSLASRTVAQTLLDHTAALYLVSDSAAYVNLYMNSFVHLPLLACQPTLDQITDMPFGPRVKLRLGGFRGGTRFTLCLRVPDWQHAPLTIYVNGRDEELPVDRGYVRIDRRWNPGDEVFFDFDFEGHDLGDDTWQVGPLRFVPLSAADAAAHVSDDLNDNGHPYLRVDGRTLQPLMDSKN